MRVRMRRGLGAMGVVRVIGAVTMMRVMAMMGVAPMSLGLLDACLLCGFSALDAEQRGAAAQQQG
jgi:hypothetical protein